MNRRTFVAAGMALAAAGRAGAQTLTPLRVGLIPGDMSGQVFFGRDLGLFSKAGFDLQISPTNNGPAIAAAIVSGSLDVGYSNPVSLVIAHDKGLPFTILTAANMYRSDAPTTGQLLVLKTSPIQSAADLNGKTIAVGGLNIITHIAARAWIDANGGDSSTAHFIEVPLPAMPAAVQAGRIDAAMFNAGIDPTLGKAGRPVPHLGECVQRVLSILRCGNVVYDQVLASRASIRCGEIRTRHARRRKVGGRAPHEAAQILSNNLKENLQAVESATPVDYGAAVTPAMIQPVIDLCAKYNVIKRASRRRT